jgi:hypothetical protein
MKGLKRKTNLEIKENKTTNTKTLTKKPSTILVGEKCFLYFLLALVLWEA